MAKTTKTTKAKAKKNGLNQTFNLKSRKVQFFVSILVIAIIGGGYFTLKSFAATTTIVFGADALVQMPITGCTIQKTDDTSGKNPIRVVNVACSSQSNLGTGVVANRDFTSLPAGNIRGCATVKGTGQINFNVFGDFLAGNVGNPAQPYVNVPNDGNYHTYCSGTFVGNGKGGYRIIVNVKNNIFINVSSLTLETVNTATAPINPTPAK